MPNFDDIKAFRGGRTDTFWVQHPSSLAIGYEQQAYYHERPDGTRKLVFVEGTLRKIQPAPGEPPMDPATRRFFGGG